MPRRRLRARRAGSANAGAVIGALLPLVAGGAVLLQDPAPPVIAVAPLAVAAAPRPLSPPAPGGVATALAELPSAPPDSATPACIKRFALALPVQRGEDAARRNTLICRRGYVLSLDVDTRNPDWVMERLSPADFSGSAKRSNDFEDDPALPKEVDANNSDYLRTGFDRGHQAPAGDAKFSQTIMDESFFFTNMAPQVGIGFNRGAWKFLEESVRDWVSCGGHTDTYVITGPIYAANPATLGGGRVAIPASFYKIVYDPKIRRAVGFVLPNKKIGSRIELSDYVKPIESIETETGLNFFAGFDQRTQARLETSKGVPWGHIASCKPEAVG